ncbi:hypothetical protein LEP1GSC175_0192 [Leptospira santarosai str. HAI821]|nr:hypothetical protein LEP1GSC169_2974 [Leptospira santarosai str. HAI1349]EMO31176.1 hypothetical protein LEP1GSC175_0192 [Leptospira santarosai str. HAI821]
MIRKLYRLFLSFESGSSLFSGGDFVRCVVNHPQFSRG